MEMMDILIFDFKKLLNDPILVKLSRAHFEKRAFVFFVQREATLKCVLSLVLTLFLLLVVTGSPLAFEFS